jgi:hypothetical protein
LYGFCLTLVWWNSCKRWSFCLWLMGILSVTVGMRLEAFWLDVSGGQCRARRGHYDSRSFSMLAEGGFEIREEFSRICKTRNVNHHEFMIYDLTFYCLAQ